MIWRPVLAKITTLEEIERHWSINDLYDAHEAMDVKSEMDQLYRDLAKQDQ